MSRLPIDSESVRRLADLEHGTDLERRAAALLARVPAPPPLHPAALSRIEARLRCATDARVTARTWTWQLSLSAAAVLGLLLLAGVLHQRGGTVSVARAPVPPAAVPAPRQFHARPGELSRQPLPGGGDMELAGPGEATISDAAVVLLQGRLLVHAGTQQVKIVLPRGQAVVPAAGTASIEVRDFRTVRVAAYAGSTILSLENVTTTVAAGASFPAGTAAGADSTEAPQPSAEQHTGHDGGKAVRPRSPGASAGPVAGDVVPQAEEQVPAAVPAPEPQSLLSEESQMLAGALKQLRQERDAAGTLSSLDAYRARFPRGTLAPEAAAARVDALLMLGRRGQALAELDGMAPANEGRAGLLVLRGELRAAAGRTGDALADFGSVLASRPAEGIEERALYGSASCKARLGDPAGARADLQRYLERFPNGRFSDAARESLGK